MNSPLKIGLLVACALGGVWNSPAVTVNDGTTTNNLIQLSNLFGAGGAVDSLTADTNGVLVAAQSESALGGPDWALRTFW